MTQPYFINQTLDDMMREVIEALIIHGDQIHPTKGSAKELAGVLLEISDPRARLSRTETRGKPFSCLGEFCWYLSGTHDLAFISYYIPEYKQYADEDIIYGGYGPRLFCYRGINQVANVINMLKRKSDSRQAVIQLFDASDIAEEHKDIPCTCTLQFMIRRSALHLVTYMRSNDVFLGLPHDVFSFTLLQEIMARTFSVELGTYKHAVGSLHLYDTNREAAEQFLAEGWQSTIPMPPMPEGNPWPAINKLQAAEAAIRTHGSITVEDVNDMDPYWLDLVRLLQVFRCYKDKNVNKAGELRQKISSNVYYSFVDQKIQKLSKTAR